MADSFLEKATSALREAKDTVIASAETAKTDVVKDAVDNVVSKGIDGAKTLLHGLEEKKMKSPQRSWELLHTLSVALTQQPQPQTMTYRYPQTISHFLTRSQRHHGGRTDVTFLIFSRHHRHLLDEDQLTC